MAEVVGICDLPGQSGMKQKLVGTYPGGLLLLLRSWQQLRSIPFGNPEKASVIANGILADRLIAALPVDHSRFLDIGAHIGSILSAVHRKNRSISIFAIEAEKGKARSLTSRFPHCQILNFAVGEQDGTVMLQISERSGYNTIVKGESDATFAEQQVELRMLDTLFAEEVFETIKIDIEGAELGALRGGAGLIERSRPTIMFESAGTGENSLGYSASKLFNWFVDNGFEIFTPDRLAHTAPPMTLPSFEDAHAYPQRTHNFFAVPVEKRSEVRTRARQILGIRAT